MEESYDPQNSIKSGEFYVILRKSEGGGAEKGVRGSRGGVVLNIATSIYYSKIYIVRKYGR